jgi:hypothetical protein
MLKSLSSCAICYDISAATSSDLGSGPIHHGAAIADICRRYPRLHLVPLPAYAPEQSG